MRKRRNLGGVQSGRTVRASLCLDPWLSGGGALVLCAEQAFWKSVQRQLLAGGHPAFRELRPALVFRWPRGPQNCGPEPFPDCREVSGW